MIEAVLEEGCVWFLLRKLKQIVDEEYDETKEKSISSLDANSLYGLSMIQKLPYKNFKWGDTLQEEDTI